MSKADYVENNDVYRRLVARQSRSRGIRDRADERTVPQGAQRRFPADDEQPYGTDGRDRRSGNAREQRFGAVDAAIGILP